MLTNLDGKEIAARLNEFMTEYAAKADLPIVIRMTMAQLIPAMPAMLAKTENQAELLGLVRRICWVLGIDVEFHPEPEKAALLEC